MTHPKKSELVHILESIGKAPEIIQNPEGASIVILPYGGRILGLYPPTTDENLLWTNPRLSDPKTAAEYFASHDWHNSGGDRTWLAPELDFFFPEFPDTSIYFQPRQLDPGNYRVTYADKRSVCIENQLELRAYRSKRDLSLDITKTVSASACPLTDSALTSDVEYAGYTVRSSLEIDGTTADPCFVGLWHLLQLPSRGEMVIPIHTRTEPTVFFGDIPNGDLRVEDCAIRYRMGAEGEQKISVPAAALTGRAGYHYRSEDERVLVVRDFAVDPSGEYHDVSSTRQDEGGFAFQACNINSLLGSFAELEHHVPAIGGSTGRTRSDEECQVWSFRGPEESIARIATSLFGIE